MRKITLALCLLVLTCATGAAFAQEVDEVDPSFLANAHSKSFHPTPHDLTNGMAHSRFGIHGIPSPTSTASFLPMESISTAIRTATGIPTQSEIRRRWAAPR